MDINYSKVKSQLTDSYKYRIEMHAHTNPVSPCGEAAPTEAVRIYAGLGYDALCITNHFIKFLFDDHSVFKGLSKEQKIDRYLADFEEARIEGEKLGINVILGAELRFIENNNDYLIYGIDRDILLKTYDYLDGTVENFRKNVSLPDSIFIQAHPFRNGITPADPSLLDGIETFNTHIGHNQRPPLAVKYAAENKLDLTISGSDFHHIGIGNEGTSALRAKTLPANSFELAALLKQRDYILEIGETAIVLP